MSDITLDRAIIKVEQAIDSAITPAHIYIDPVLEAARLVANAKQFIRPLQSELNRELRAALGRGWLAPWERDIEALLNIAAALTEGDTQ